MYDQLLRAVDQYFDEVKVLRRSARGVITLLRHARLAPLYSRDRRDAIVIFGLSHNMTLGEINDKLYAEDADTLC